MLMGANSSECFGALNAQPEKGPKGQSFYFFLLPDHSSRKPSHTLSRYRLINELASWEHHRLGRVGIPVQRVVTRAAERVLVLGIGYWVLGGLGGVRRSRGQKKKGSVVGQRWIEL